MGAEEVYAEWVMRAVHADWTARENLWNLAASNVLFKILKHKAKACQARLPGNKSTA